MIGNLKSRFYLPLSKQQPDQMSDCLAMLTRMGSRNVNLLHRIECLVGKLKSLIERSDYGVNLRVQ
jgi:hypothetical protein